MREISRLLDDTESKRVQNERELKLGMEDFRNKEESITQSEEGKRRDVILVEDGIKHLREMQDNAFTNVLKERCQRAIEVLDIEKEMAEELEELGGKLGDIKRTLKTLREKKELLERVRSEDEEEKRLALVLCLERGILKRAVVNVSEFRAMEGVEEVFDIDGVMKKKLIDVGEGVMVSEPLIVEKRFRVEGSCFYTSLSQRNTCYMFME